MGLYNQDRKWNKRAELLIYVALIWQIFQSDHQNFFQLASIQSASLGYSVIIVGKQLATEYGPGTAICSIVVGNMLLWLVAIAIIFMVDRVHANAIENIKSYIGKYGGLLAAAVLLCAFMNWYAFSN